MSEKEIRVYLRHRIKGKKHYRLWQKILDVLDQNPRPVIKIIFKNPELKPSIGPIIGASFGQPGLRYENRCDLIVIRDLENMAPRFIALKEIKDIEEVKQGA